MTGWAVTPGPSADAKQASLDAFAPPRVAPGIQRDIGLLQKFVSGDLRARLEHILGKEVVAEMHKAARFNSSLIALWEKIVNRRWRRTAYFERIESVTGHSGAAGLSFVAFRLLRKEQ